MKWKNNKGSAFVMVLVILAIVGVLAAVALWVSLVNYQMKQTDIKVKNNFYSAESVLDQICVGLQEDVSEAYTKAYDTVIMNYAIMNAEERKAVLESNYKKNLKLILQKNGDSMSFDLARLKNYVYKPLWDGSGLDHADIVARIDNANVSEEKGKMIVYEKNIVLQGIEVTFTDRDAVTSIISTDISLAVPEMKLATSQESADTADFTLIGNQGIDITGMNTAIKGDVYAGNKGASTDISLNIGSNVTFSNMRYLLSDGTTKINLSKKLVVDTGSDFWTNNIVVDDGAVALLQGNTIVADDMTLQGVKPSVYLGPRNVVDYSSNGKIGGSYVGFGNSKKDSAESSAIILNGSDSLLDMSSLNELLVGGYSYVNTSKIKPTEGNINNNIAMGESIAVKGGQIGYLIPPELICVENGVSLFNKNPITEAEYKEATSINEHPNMKEVDEVLKSPRIGKSLKDYFPEGTLVNSMFSRVFDQKNQLVYYYVNLDPQEASKYFLDYSTNSNLDKLNMYTDYYADKIQFRENSRMVFTAGNYTRYDGDKAILVNLSNQSIDELLLGYKEKYVSLMRTLSKKTLTAEDLSRHDVFDYLIDSAKFEDALNANHSTNIEVVYTAKNGKKYKVVLTSDDYEYSASSEADGAVVSLIICSKNVNLKKNFKGTVIAKGQIKVMASVDNVEKGETEIRKELLKQEVAPGELVYNVFRDGTGFTLSANELSGDAETYVGKTPYSEIITYQNWLMK